QENMELLGTGPESFEKTKREVLDLLKRTLRPEFLNRIDEIIMFHPLTEENVRQILQIQADRIVKLLEEKDIKLTLTDNALDYLQKKGYEPVYGARPLKRLLQRELVNELARRILEGSVESSRPVTVDSDGEKLMFLS
ncbi:MAG TPA: type VI secretion system ATPase TssH, partial [Bacteroidales bacterium]|nr:type VI secretion system ATPase TssH [Bacteroidales bacterium]